MWFFTLYRILVVLFVLYGLFTGSLAEHLGDLWHVDRSQVTDNDVRAY